MEQISIFQGCQLAYFLAWILYTNLSLSPLDIFGPVLPVFPGPPVAPGIPFGQVPALSPFSPFGRVRPVIPDFPDFPVVPWDLEDLYNIIKYL